MALDRDFGSRDATIAELPREVLAQEKVEAESLFNSQQPDSISTHPSRDESDLVTWDGPHDPANPHNWSKAYRWWATILCGVMTLNVCVYSQTIPLRELLIFSLVARLHHLLLHLVR